MDMTYAGTYGRLNAMYSDFLSDQFMAQLRDKGAEDFVNMLSTTHYRREIDSFSSLYKIPDLVEVVLNAHLGRLVREASTIVPPQAADFVSAYVSKWDIENIKAVLSSKLAGFELGQTESFLVVGDNTPVGIFGGKLSRQDLAGMAEQKDIEGAVNYLVRYKYGEVLLGYVEEAKKSNSLAGMILSLDMYYYNRLSDTFKFYNGDEGPLLGYIRDSIDVRNAMNAIKASIFGYDPEDLRGYYFMKGGRILENRLIEMSRKGIESMKQDMPFKIDYAFESYKSDPLLVYFDVALKNELQAKYVPLFKSLPISAGSIIAFMLRAEMERDRLRSLWYGKHYGISPERVHALSMAL